ACHLPDDRRVEATRSRRPVESAVLLSNHGAGALTSGESRGYGWGGRSGWCVIAHAAGGAPVIRHPSVAAAARAAFAEARGGAPDAAGLAAARLLGDRRAADGAPGQERGGEQ